MKNSNERTHATDEQWQGRFVEAKDISDDVAVNIMKKTYNLIKDFLPSDCDADSFRLVVWNEGDSGDLHSDDIVPWRKYSSIIYLNHNFVGGYTDFPNQSVAIQPREGLAVLFEGNSNYPHRVTEIASGTRYTIASFWTDQDEHKFYKGWNND